MFRQRGVLRKTLVVIVSDHGEHLGTHGMWGHRFLTYQDLVRVALMIREPGRRAGVRIAAPVQLSDLYTTVLNATLTRAGRDQSRDSHDLLASARHGGEPRIAVCECSGPAPTTMKRFEGRTDPVVLHRTTSQIAAVGPRFKLIKSGDGHRELYDLVNDPGELHNLLEELPSQAAQLETYLRTWLESTPEFALPGEVNESPSPEALRSLRSLGYVGDGE